MAIERIMCCCGAGVGSSLIVRMNTEDVLKKLGMDDIQVNHTSVDDLEPDEADLYILAGDLRGINTGIPEDKIIMLSNILDRDELASKLTKKLGL
ncbi:MAG: PTS sugar transporter subunit IIB [Atopobiaceae bacterium]|jgi:PTS system ascorbate-specific IIB component